MKWKGIVSQRSQRIIASRFAIANANQPSSTALRLSQAVSGMSDCLDRRTGAELVAETADADVHDVRVRIEVIAPDLGEQPLAADDLARTFEQPVQDLELAVGEIDNAVAELRLAAGEIERQRADAQDVVVRSVFRPPQVDANPCEELLERERFRQVVARAEPEAVQLRRQVGPRRDDHDRDLRLLGLERPEDAQTVKTRQQEIEDDEVAAESFGKAEPLLAISRAAHREALRLEPARKEVQDSRLIFDDENPHCSLRAPTITHRSPRREERRHLQPGLGVVRVNRPTS